MSANKELLIEAAETSDKFLELLKRHHARDDNFDLGEVIPTLDRRQLDAVWSNLQMEFTGTILSFGQEEETYEDSCRLIQGIVTVGMETITLEEPYLPEPFIQSAIMLHGVLLSLPEDVDKIKNSISRLFELWWKQDMMCRHEVATHTIIYLMERAERANGMKADVKRVYQMHEVLGLVDLSSDSSSSLREHLKAASVSLLYLKTEEGRKFLSHALNQSPAMTDMLHKVIKSHLPWGPKSIMPFYGEIYFRAWRNAIGPNLEKLELGCIQDLMYHGILAQPGLVSSLRQILGYIHQQKAQRGVDQMLVTLYEPILWRHLKVANGQVRLHAVLILIDAFPLHSPDWGVQERDHMMQKQFDTLREMLYDPLPAVRVAVVLGICSICDQYWELIPADVIKDLIHCMVNDMAYDGASADVRGAVFRGLTKLIDNPLTHPMLKTLLPQMSSCFHDVSEKVRLAFVDMLLKVKTVKAVKFWDVVPLNHLLSRLEVDTAPIARRLVKLLLNSYLPPDKAPQIHLARCMHLVEMDPGAARRFYQYVVPHTTLGTAVRLIATILVTFSACLEKIGRRKSTNHCPAPVEPDFLESFEEEDRGSPSTRPVAAAAGDDEEDLLSNKDTVAGLLEVVTILWTSVSSQLNTEAANEMRDKLEMRASQVLPRLYSHYQDPRILTALFKVSGFVSPSLLPAISRSLLSKLKHMGEDTPHDEYAPILEVMCLWGKVNDVLELVSDWLMSGLHGDHPPEAKNRRSRSVSFAEPVESKPLLALKYINHLMLHKVCQEILLSKANRPALAELTIGLRTIKKCVERRLQSPTSLGDQCTDELLARTFEIYLKLEILLHDQKNKDHNCISVVEQILSWTDMELLALLKQKKKKTSKTKKLLGQTEMTLLQDPTGDGATLSSQTGMGTVLGMTTLNLTSNDTFSDTLIGQKRSAGDGETGVLKVFALDLIQRLLKVTSDMLLVGRGDQELASHLADFAILLLKIDESSMAQFLIPVCRLMYQITEMMLTHNAVTDEGVGSHGDIVPAMINKLLEVIIILTVNKKEQAERMLPMVKPALVEMLGTYYHHNSLNNTVHRDLMATIAAAIITNMATVVEQDNDYETRHTVQELPTLTAFFFSVLWKRSSLVSLLLSEIQQCVVSGSLDKLEQVVGICHVLNTLSKCKRSISELKECLQSVDLLLSQQGEALEQDMEDSPARHLHISCRAIVEQCKTQIGMV